MKFEWDENKNQINQKKHGIDFETAVRIFLDDNRLEIYDFSHSGWEDRYITIGMIQERIVILTLVYTERGDTIRVISARKATNEERRIYYAGNL